jgi:hypothetical protein
MELLWIEARNLHGKHLYINILHCSDSSMNSINKLYPLDDEESDNLLKFRPGFAHN